MKKNYSIALVTALSSTLLLGRLEGGVIEQEGSPSPYELGGREKHEQDPQKRAGSIDIERHSAENRVEMLSGNWHPTRSHVADEQAKRKKSAATASEKEATENMHASHGTISNAASAESGKVENKPQSSTQKESPGEMAGRNKVESGKHQDDTTKKEEPKPSPSTSPK